MVHHPTDPKKIAIIGGQPEALFLSVLFAEAGVPNSLVGSFEARGDRVPPRSPLDEACWLLGIHQRAGKIRLLEDVEETPTSDLRNLIFTHHNKGEKDASELERIIRITAKNIPKSCNFTFTGLSKPGYTSTIGEIIQRFTGLRVGLDVGLCYLPLLWSGETLTAFRETPRIIAGTGEDAAANAQETFLKIFPSISSTPKIRDAEAAGLFSPIYRDVVGALEMELARLCVDQGVDYADALGLCRGLGLNILGSPRPFSRVDTVASEIALTLLQPRNGPLLIRAAKRVNEESQSQIVGMVKNVLARCGQRLRHSKIAVLGLDGLGVNAKLKPETPGVLLTLKRRGASVSVYPGNNQSWMSNSNIGEDVKVERSMTKAVENARCALIGFQRSENEDLNPQKLAAEMNAPAAICDLTGVMEASNVERAGLLYASIGRGYREI